MFLLYGFTLLIMDKSHDMAYQVSWFLWNIKPWHSKMYIIIMIYSFRVRLLFQTLHFYKIKNDKCKLLQKVWSLLSILYKIVILNLSYFEQRGTWVCDQTDRWTDRQADAGRQGKQTDMQAGRQIIIHNFLGIGLNSRPFYYSLYKLGYQSDSLSYELRWPVISSLYWTPLHGAV